MRNRSGEEIVLKQMIRAARLDRSLYTKLLFDDYATGNAVAIIVLMFAIPVLIGGSLSASTADIELAGRLSITGTALEALNSIIRAGLSAVAAWAVATRIVGADGRIPVTFRLAGYAHVAFAPMLLYPLFRSTLSLLLLLSAGWYFLAIRTVAAVQFDVDDRGALQVAAAAVAAWYLAFLIFP